MRERKRWLISRDKLFEISTTKQTEDKKERCRVCDNLFTIYFPRWYTMLDGKHGQFPICYDCATGEHSQIPQLQRYGFWLRFLSKHFIPCGKCQDKLYKQMNTQEVNFHEGHNDIAMIISQSGNEPKVKFRFGFLWRNNIFTPCKRCQKKVIGAWQISQFHIGNDNKPLIEFWRDWADIEFKEINKPKLKKCICLHCGKKFMQTFEKQRFCKKHLPN